MLSPDNFQWSDPAGSNQFGNIFDEWVDSVQWLNSDSINWVSCSIYLQHDLN